MTEISYHFMTEEDVSAVARLEQQAFAQPWSEAGIAHYLEAGVTLFIVAKDGTEVAGYAAVMCVLDEGNLISIVVDEKYKRMGIASELLDILYEELKNEQVKSLYLEVRESNDAAIGLYEKQGFVRTGYRKDYYKLPTEDALLYMKLLG